MYEAIETGINKVLIVEDERLVAMLIESHLVDLGYFVSRICNSGEEAIKYLRENQVDIVLMDVKLSGELDGIQTAKTLIDLYNLPVIFITAYADSGTFNKAKLSSPYGYLTKPINKGDLKNNIELAIYKHHMFRILQENEEKYRLLFNSTNDMVFVNSIDEEYKIGAFIEVNNVLCNYTGFSREELSKMKFVDILDETALDNYLKAIDKIKNKNSFLFEAEIKSKNQNRLLVEVNSYQFSLKGQEGIISIARNITEKRQLEIQLLQSQKMEAIGRLSGCIAHDFNNFLTIVLCNADLILNTMNPEDPNYNRVNSIREASERTSKIVKQLLSMSKTEQFENVNLDINTLLKKMFNMLDKLVPEKVKFSLRLSQDIPLISVDPSRIEGVILNLFINALDALEEGGELIISTERIDSDHDSFLINGNSEIQSLVLIQVIDTGIGIPPEILENIFDPFYTTKKHGTGLGLSTVYGIIHQLGGHVLVDSTFGKGSVFSLYIPATTESEKNIKKSADIPEPSLLKGREKILVVEDDQTLLEFTMEFLKGLGYNIETAYNGDIAFDIIQEKGKSFDLMLIDAILPGKSSKEIIELYKNASENPRILCMSGYGDSVIDREGLSSIDLKIIKKPFTSSFLAVTIREMLDN